MFNERRAANKTEKSYSETPVPSTANSEGVNPIPSQPRQRDTKFNSANRGQLPRYPQQHYQQQQQPHQQHQQHQQYQHQYQQHHQPRQHQQHYQSHQQKNYNQYPSYQNKQYQNRSRDTHRDQHSKRHQSDRASARAAVVPLASLKPSDSRWDKVPTRLTGFSAKFLKMNGVFQSPSTNSVDLFTEKDLAELMEKQKALEAERILSIGKQKLPNPSNAVVSKRIIFKNLDVEKCGGLAVVHKYLENLLASTVIPNVSYDDIGIVSNVEGENVVVKCVSSLVATTLMSFNTKQIDEWDGVKLTVERPGEYVQLMKNLDDLEVAEETEELEADVDDASGDVAEEKNVETEVKEESNVDDTDAKSTATTADDDDTAVADVTVTTATSTDNTAPTIESKRVLDEIVQTASLICVNNLKPELSNHEITETLSKYGQLHSLAVLIDKITYDSNGVGFFQFRQLNDKTKKLHEIISDINKTEKWNCFLVCENKENQYYQNIDLTVHNIREAVDLKTTDISKHKLSNTIQILNAVSYSALTDENKLSAIESEFQTELAKLKGFVKMHLVRPSSGFRYISDEIKPEYGRIYALFTSDKGARNCLNQVCGKLFQGRIILGGYIDSSDYSKYFI